MDLVSTRTGYGKGLAEIGKDKKVVVLDADLSGSTKSAVFCKKYPDRFFNLGIAEQDMIGTAAGFALSGKIPFASTFAVFANARAHDQIRVSVAYSNLNVRVVGSHAGLLTGEDGPTHQAICDISTMRSMPNMAVIHPADGIEAEMATKYLLKHKGPVYLRLGRVELPLIFNSNYKFRFGKGIVLEKGKAATIIATGPLVHEALKAREQLKKQGMDVKVINMHTIKPIDKNLIIKSAKETGAIVTAEDHSVFGGLGSAVAEVIVENCPVPIEFIGVKDVFAESGRPYELYEKYGLSYKHITKAVMKVIKRK